MQPRIVSEAAPLHGRAWARRGDGCARARTGDDCGEKCGADRGRGRNPRSSRPHSGCEPRDLEQARERGLSSAMLDRLLLDDKRVEAMARGVEDIASLADPIGVATAEWTRPNGLHDTPRSRAARRRRHHLRKPAQCDRGRRCAVPEVRQRRDPARRLREHAFESRHTRMSRRRAARGVACRKPPFSLYRRLIAPRSVIILSCMTQYDRCGRAARRAQPGRACAEGGARAGDRPSRRQLPRLCALGGERRDGPRHRAQCEAAPHGRLRRGRDGVVRCSVRDARRSSSKPCSTRAARCAATSASRGSIRASGRRREQDWATEYLDAIIAARTVDGVERRWRTSRSTAPRTPSRS